MVEYDYDDIQYGIPFNEFYGNMRNRYVGFGRATFPDYVKTGHIQPYREGNNVLLITGCSDNHFMSVVPAMYAMLNASATVNIAFIDYGLLPEQVEELKSVFDYIHRVHVAMNASSLIVYRKFDFRKAPTWMNIFDCQTRGGYAWKVIGYMDLLSEWKAMGAWIDAGSIINDGIDMELMYAKMEGMYVPPSPGNVGMWTHPSMIQFVESMGLTGKVDRNETNCSSGHFFMDFSNTTAVNTIFKPFLQCAYTMKCITPRGSSKANHRQEQAGITLFLHNAHLVYSARGRYAHYPLFRQEKNDGIEFEEFKENIKKEINRRYGIHVM